MLNDDYAAARHYIQEVMNKHGRYSLAFLERLEYDMQVTVELANNMLELQLSDWVADHFSRVGKLVFKGVF